MKITPERLIDIFVKGPIKDFCCAAKELAEKTDGATDDNPAAIGDYNVRSKIDYTDDKDLAFVMLGFVIEEVSALRKDVKKLLKRGREKRHE